MYNSYKIQMFNIFKKNSQLTGKDFSRKLFAGLVPLEVGFRRKPRLLTGFTLVELMVSVSIFAIVMFISLGSILSILDANQKSKTLRSVMDNLNSAMESMTRTVRFGINYHCGSSVFAVSVFYCPPTCW